MTSGVTGDRKVGLADDHHVQGTGTVHAFDPVELDIVGGAGTGDAIAYTDSIHPPRP